MYNMYEMYVYKIYLYKIYVYKLFVYNLNASCPRSVIFCSALFLNWSTRSLCRDLVNAYYAGMLQVNKEEEIQKNEHKKKYNIVRTKKCKQSIYAYNFKNL